MPVQAEVLSVQGEGHERGHVRHQLRLPVQGLASGACGAVIHNLSQTGLLIETSDNLALGELIQVDLPEAGVRAAKIVWHSDRLFGCQFEEPLRKGAISAALLRSPTKSSPSTDPAPPTNAGPQQPSPESQDNGDVDSAGVRRLPARTRLLVIAGLSGACWALVGIPVALLAL